MYGISTIIVVILLLMIVVSLAALSYTFFSQIFTSTTKPVTSTINRTTTSLLSQMKIESVSTTNISLRNIGNKPLTGFAVYINDKPIKFTTSSISVNVGEIIQIKLYFTCSDLKGNLRITTMEGASAEKNIDLAKMNPDIVLCMSFDDGTAKDYSIYGNSGTISGAEIVDGKYGKGLNFTASLSDYVYIPNSPSLTYFDKQTLMAWINPAVVSSSPPTYGGIVGKWVGGANYLLVLYPTTIWYWISDGTTSDNVWENLGALTANQWYHVAGTSNSTHLKVFRDGALSSNEKSTTIKIGTNTSNVIIGTYGGYFDGIIDEVRIYNRSLTQQEINDIASS